jgi:homoserine kinase type II
MWPRRMTVQHCGPVGEALAGLHLAGRDFGIKRPNALSVSGWRPLYEGSRGHIDQGLAQELGGEIDFFEQNWPKDLPAGVIHADLFNDNVFFLHDRLSGLIDFYFACNDFLAYDVAICINAWCFEPDNAFNATKARALLQAYDKVRKLGDDERRVLPLLARGSALRFLLTRLYDWVHTPKDALVKRKDPKEYLAKLRFHRNVTSLADYGL